eukprot:gene52614-12028_t
MTGGHVPVSLCITKMAGDYDEKTDLLSEVFRDGEIKK